MSCTALRRGPLVGSSRASPARTDLRPRRNFAVRANTGKIAVGDAAPDFELIAGGFVNVKLSDHKGKKVVLAFFPCAFSGAVDDGCQCQVRTKGR